MCHTWGKIITNEDIATNGVMMFVRLSRMEPGDCPKGQNPKVIPQERSIPQRRVLALADKGQPKSENEVLKSTCLCRF